MVRLGEQLGEWLSRVELLARGTEHHRAEAVRALAAGRPWDAREHALAIVDESPRSRVGLALWADAADAALLDHEVLEALERLSREVPFRADVWLRLGEARARAGDDPTSALLRAAEQREPVAAADAARLALADRDLSRGDPARAERWLEQQSLGARESPEALWRRLEVALERDDLPSAERVAAVLPEPALLDARSWRARARYLDAVGDPNATAAHRRALLLDAPKALRAAAGHVASLSDRAARASLGSIVSSVGLGDHPLWRAAYAEAEGRPEEALRAMADGARSDPALVGRYLALALAARDLEALRAADSFRAGHGQPVDPGALALLAALSAKSSAERLAELDGALGAAEPWAAALRRETYRDWLPGDAPANWRELGEELERAARELGRLEALSALEAISRDLERPLSVAVVGEFNAGKSSLINALLGEDVAPVGVLPTTATRNRLVWAADRFVRIERRDRAPDRVVSHADLRSTLDEIGPAAVECVTIYAPLELLRKIELTDTPGFNAPDPAHAARARESFRDAHVALWLLDASQPLKGSERSVLSEIAALGLPLFVLLNKIDRVGEGLAEARAHVETGMSEVGIVPAAPLVAFSARQALAGRAGDADALAASRFGEVEALVRDVLVAESAALREQALRRRAREVAAELAGLVQERSDEARADAERARSRRERFRALASELASNRGELVRRIDRALPGPVSQFRSEVEPVGAIVAEPAARRFVEQRGRDVLGKALVGVVLGVFEPQADDVAALEAAFAPRLEALAAASAVRLVEIEGDAGRARLEAELAELVGDEVGCALTDLCDIAVMVPAPAMVARIVCLANELETT
jgi:GTPase Era involved in 16S rRNA processing